MKPLERRALLAMDRSYGQSCSSGVTLRQQLSRKVKISSKNTRKWGCEWGYRQAAYPYRDEARSASSFSEFTKKTPDYRKHDMPDRGLHLDPTIQLYIIQCKQKIGRQGDINSEIQTASEMSLSANAYSIAINY